ncbi:MAG: hypothetical protein QXE05_10735 [Nitrososphaeria archaeon]
MKVDLKNFGRCGQVSAYANSWVGNSWEDSTIPSPRWFDRNGFLFLWKDLLFFNIFITRQLYYNIMCELLCVGREDFDLKEFIEENLGNFCFKKKIMNFEKTIRVRLLFKGDLW